MSEEENLIIGLLSKIADDGRQEELPGILVSTVMSVAGITESPMAFIAEHIEAVSDMYRQFVEDGIFPKPEAEETRQ